MHKTRQIHYLQSNIVKQTNIALLHTIQFPMCRTSHTLLVEGHVSCFIACEFQHVKLVQHHKRCAMCSPHQSHISAVQQFPHIALALIQSQCPYCVHPCKKAVPCIKFGLRMPHFLHSSITDVFHSIKKLLISIVVVFQFPSCTFIHQSPRHNCVTILGHSKYDILVYRTKIPKTVHACFHVPLLHLHRL